MIYGTTYCSLICPSGQYNSSIDHKCLLCDTNCKTCDTNSTNCITCGLTSMGLQLFFKDNFCLQNCPIGFYNKLIDSTCFACDHGCLSCTGSGLNKCETCGNYTNPDTNVKSYFYKQIGATTCNLTCPKGQFIDQEI